jgi:hypothetical protein
MAKTTARMPDVVITPAAFISLCASAIEPYGSECCGVLLGRISPATVNGR